MTSTRFFQSVAVAALLVAAVDALPAAAQQRPDAGPILSEAEQRSARRSAGDILGNIFGPSRANAQTAPAAPAPATTAGATPAPAASGTPATAPRPTAVAQTLPQTLPQPLPPQALPPAGASTPAAGAQGSGSPADPTMIVRVPQNAPANGAPTAPSPPVVLEAMPAAGPGAPAPGSATATQTASQPRILPSVGARPARAVLVRTRAGDWCPPGRW